MGQITRDFSAMNLRGGQGTHTRILTQLKRGQYFVAKKGAPDTWWQVWTCDGLKGYLYFDKIQLGRPLTALEWKKIQNRSISCENFGKSGQSALAD